MTVVYLLVLAPDLCRNLQRSRLDKDSDCSCSDLDIRHFDTHLTVADQHTTLPVDNSICECYHVFIIR